MVLIPAQKWCYMMILTEKLIILWDFKSRTRFTFKILCHFALLPCERTQLKQTSENDISMQMMRIDTSALYIRF